MTQMTEVCCAQRAHVGQRIARHALVNEGNLAEGGNNAN
jgi:hypothetical protein